MLGTLLTVALLALGITVSESDEAYYIQRMQPYLKAYRQFLDQLGVGVYEYDIEWLFPKLSRSRQLAWAEALLIRKALSRQQPREAVEQPLLMGIRTSLGLSAARKEYEQLWEARTGQYPNSFSELNWGDMVIDPFTGKPFIYRVDQRRGFQLYSVGVNLLDDGGRIARDEASGGDITAARLPSSQRPHPSGGLSAPLWLR